MIISVNNTSVQALRDFALAMPQSLMQMRNDSERLRTTFFSLEEPLGIRFDTFYELIDQCIASVLEVEDDVADLALQLNNTADSLETYINDAKKVPSKLPNVNLGRSAGYTMSTPYELSVIHEMEASGDYGVMLVDSSKAEPSFGEKHLPSEETGYFLGERGESLFIPSNPAARDYLERQKIRGVEYVDGYPNFLPFAVISSPWGEINTQVSIGHMTQYRNNPKWDFGRRNKTQSYDLNCDLGNFNQADLALAEKLISQEVAQRDIDPSVLCREVAAFRKESRLTWHECADGHTMLLIPSIIHDACRHSGGVSFEKMRSKYGDVSLYVAEEWDT